MKSNCLLFFTFLLCLQVSNAQKISEWRPENRTGVSGETGLLKSWPTEGPALLWSNLELTKGNSSVSFGNNTIYITGLKDADDILYALDMNGKLLWQTVMGRAWNGSYPESRATPTIEGKMVYTCSGFGDLACIDGTDGKIIWTYKASEMNKGTYGNWGIAESLLIDEEKLYFTPGGPETMTIAINKTTGAVIWKSPTLNDKPAYNSPILIDFAGKKVIVNMAMNNVFAVDAANGEILWKVQLEKPADFRWDFINCVTPVFSNGMIYVTTGYNCGGIMIKPGEDGKSANVVWTDKVLDVHHGGVVLLNGYLYGSNWLNNGDGNWCCIEWATGKKMWEEHWNCKGSVIAADGLIYIYDEKKGNVGLVKPNTEKFELVSSFQIKQGNSGPFWAHPVIHNGILYIRHTNALMAYDIKEK
ncbi:MAG: PQQ-binding-like beta-propeller repeat protein [Prolixibacteraceae bacterium]